MYTTFQKLLTRYTLYTPVYPNLSSAPDPMLQISTIGFSPLPQIILDPPGWTSITNSRGFICHTGRGQKFSKLDLSHAYQQVLLEEGSRQFVTSITHRGFIIIVACHLGYPWPLLYSNNSWSKFYRAYQK